MRTVFRFLCGVDFFPDVRFNAGAGNLDDDDPAAQTSGPSGPEKPRGRLLFFAPVVPLPRTAPVVESGIDEHEVSVAQGSTAGRIVGVMRSRAAVAKKPRFR